MKHPIIVRTATLAFLTLLSAGAAFADSEGTSASSNKGMNPGDGRSAMLPEIGIYGGGARTTGKQYKTDGSFQAEVGITPFAPFNLAVQAQYSPSSLDVPLADIRRNTTNFLLKETVSLGTSGTDLNTNVHLAVGGTLGFDIPLMPTHTVSLGAEGTYLAVLGGDSNAVTPDQTSVLGAVKYWF